jgi:hypothetical protein
MKRRPFKRILAMLTIMLMSCNEPETVVTNFVHTDGSVTRVIMMKSVADKPEERFQASDLQVPFDNTWKLKDSTELTEKGDTVWIRRAEKLFKNAGEINLTYKKDSGANRNVSRQARFVKKFRWFNTEFRFSEKMDKTISFGYPVKDFLNREELLWFYSPDVVRHEKETGPDSLKFRVLTDTLKKKVDHWTIKNLVSEWIGEFAKLTEGKDGADSARKSLEAREDQFVSLVSKNENKFDSLWSNGIILKEYLGEANYNKFQMDADTAIEKVTRSIFTDFKEYSESIVMPGKLTGTNGFIDSSKVLLWPVKSDYFLTEPYEMWAESKIPNIWAWIVSGLFLVFVLTGMIIKINRKG